MAKKQDGAKYDFDGKYGTQCVEFVKAYVNYLVNGDPWSDCWNRPTLNGNNIWQNFIWKELGWTVYTNTADFMPQPGDIFSAGTSNGNHTGVVISSDLNKAVIADANARNSDWSDGDPVYLHTINWRSASSDTAYGATHYIRPNFWSSSSGKPVSGTPVVSSAKDLYEYGETVVLTRNTVQNTNYYWLVMYHYDEMIISKSFDESCVLYDLDAGWYTAYLQVGNATSGTVTSVPYKFYVQKRLEGTPTISSDKEFYAYGEDVTLTRNTVKYTNYYWLTVELNGKQILSQSMDELKYTLSNPVPGVYSTYISVGNGISGKVTAGGRKFYVYSYGWNKFDSYWYYCNGNGPVKGWKCVDGKWYYLNPSNSGKMQTGWVKLSGKWYYLSSSGVMVTGWQTIGGKWYYFNNSGTMMTGWAQVGGKWYYMNSSGVMVTGWAQVGGKWYYMNSNGAMVTGWAQIGGKWYYMKSDGAMVTGTQRINGKTYWFNSNGVWIG